MRLCVVFFLGLWLPCVAWSSRLPIPDHGPALRLQGSNTIGAALAPALVRGLMEDQGLLKVSTEITGRDNEQRIVGQTADASESPSTSPPTAPAPGSSPSSKPTPTWPRLPGRSRTAN